MNDELLLQTFIPRPQPLRIALVTETYPPEINGVAMTVGRQVIDLQKRGHQVQVIKPKQNTPDTATNNTQLEALFKMGVPIPRHASFKIGMPAKPSLVRLG